MITRAVLLDVSGCDGGQHLNPGRVVTPEELSRAAKVAIEPGDIALIRTGWGRYFGIDNPRYLQGEPGIDLPGAKWLIERGVVAIGCDNWRLKSCLIRIAAFRCRCISMRWRRRAFI